MTNFIAGDFPTRSVRAAIACRGATLYKKAPAQ
ncbi:hypothetical protein BSS2_II0591 [Brucella suis bv. 1 str. S2]|uniref:Uncharacterized protein n=3 Tax=Brucella TaxID=234 RepID=Q578B6_BRUAB|nr:hypothetical protein BRA0619 [Brucella suis 1330]AAX76018.1 hypothetical protein BruAb2_0606 [Brucella abortus bv. 1 str. 9-941]ACU49743.1 hypothetical protein BMI_II616 [Brucella microti CCM 4915]AEK56100.1 hypothetical protein BPI_II674 [Brucella pinnipedialis B2/94]AEU07756.1 hypothetical protein BSVBI22_B0613 [Brucella suis VBI22]AHN48353.1 hypothetical protein BSS2_II0591 [Brucella suis bv. 1 str. S2]CDL78158.1 unnamed protein product [Brucella canis str. Oliveri]